MSYYKIEAMKFSEIAQILNPNTKITNDSEILWLLTDSRNLSFPAESLFFAIKTERNNGHKYIEQLYIQNLRYFVISEEVDFEKMPDAHFIRVENTINALQKLTAAHRSKFNIPIIGITGSNGKTIVKEWLYQLLNTDYNIVRSPRSYNSQIGVPLSVWSMNEANELGIFEAGISEMNEMEHLEKIIQPNIGIFTNLGEAHQQGFSGLKLKAEEKLKLFKNSDVLIYNTDNKLVDIAVIQAKLKAKLFTWGEKDSNTVQITNIYKNNSSRIELIYQGEKQAYEIRFTDDASIENAIHTICALLYLGFDAQTIADKLLKLEPIAMRLELKQGINNSLIINDSYNSDLNSLAIALNFLSQQSGKQNLRKTVILSDIQQSGMSSEELYKQVAELIDSKGINRFVGVGKEISSFSKLFNSKETVFFQSTEELLKSELIVSFENEIILLKAARNFHFENIESRIEQRVHETKLEVNLNAIVNNLNYFRTKLKSDTKIMCVVKAFGYGSGAVEVSRILQHNRCDYLAVAVGDEGAELRKAGIKIPIIVMNPEKSAFNTIINHRLEPEIYSFSLLQAFIDNLEKEAISDYPIHLKLDTGMHRLGFEESDIPKLIELLTKQNQVKVRSIFSHLVGSESTEFDDFTNQQAEKFSQWAKEISSAFQHKILLHILNSAGIERFPEHQMDMVRLGIGLYNVSALPDVKLENVSSLRSVILQIRQVKKGDSIGYNRKTVLTRDSRIGVVPIGYADGYDRRLSNGVGKLWINNQIVPVVGNICMDALMVDLTDVIANEGDEVEIFGENITVDSMAKELGTIPYEILTGVSQRVKRVYYID